MAFFNGLVYLSIYLNRAGVDVFVLDTGVYADHLDFDGRATHSANMVSNEDNMDMGGHGKTF